MSESVNISSIIGIINQYCEETTKESIMSQMIGIAFFYQQKANIIVNLICKMNDIGLVEKILYWENKKYPELVEDLNFWINNPDALISDMTQYVPDILKECPLFTSNYMKYIVFSDYISCVNGAEAMRFEPRWVELMFIQLSFLSMYKRNKKIDSEKISIVIAAIDRSVTRAKGVNDDINKFLYENIPTQDMILYMLLMMLF